MARGTVERFFCPAHLDAWFAANAVGQYTRKVLFSTLVHLIAAVAVGSRKSVRAAYEATAGQMVGSLVAVYQKLQKIDTATSAGLVHYAAAEAADTIRRLKGEQPPLLPGYRVKLLDGNCLATSQKRIKELRGLKAGPLPGKSLVVLDPALRLPIRVFPCEDGYTQERALLEGVVATVAAGDVWIADRNFCTREFLAGIARRDGFFIIREHRNLPTAPVDRLRLVGEGPTGKLFEQRVAILHEGGETQIVRRVCIRLAKVTRDGDDEIAILTNLPAETTAAQVASLYGGRWKIETVFHELAMHLRSEIDTLGYPKAALFGFCVALLCYIVMAVLKAALQAAHGPETAAHLSNYALADELEGTERGMHIAIPTPQWRVFRKLSDAEFVLVLLALARAVNMRRFRKVATRPRKKQPERLDQPSSTHVSTARILAARKKTQ
jgi:IS4 transposase